MKTITEENANPFIELLRRAEEQNWCVQPYCTTCGARDFRSALREISGELGGPLVDALADLNLNELTSYAKWDDAIVIAVRTLPLSSQVISLLEAWLSRAIENVRFFDVVLFKFVRHLPEKYTIKEQWITKGISIAVRTKDFSLTESLILILRDKAVQHEQLIQLAKQFAADSKQMRRVLKNACKITEPPL